MNAETQATEPAFNCKEDRARICGLDTRLYNSGPAFHGKKTTPGIVEKKNPDPLEIVTCLKSEATILSALMDWMDKDMSMYLSVFPIRQTL